MEWVTSLVVHLSSLLSSFPSFVFLYVVVVSCLSLSQSKGPLWFSLSCFCIKSQSSFGELVPPRSNEQGFQHHTFFLSYISFFLIQSFGISFFPIYRRVSVFLSFLFCTSLSICVCVSFEKTFAEELVEPSPISIKEIERVHGSLFL